MGGTAEIHTERLRLRRHLPGDAGILYEKLGLDPEFYRFSGWNPYSDPERAEQTVNGFIENYDDPRFYGWAIEYGGALVGTIGAYDYDAQSGSIETGYSIFSGSKGKGFATEALRAVLGYLTEEEDIRRVTAWCAADNAASVRVLEKAGMKYVSTDTRALSVGDNKYDRMNFEYTPESSR